MAASTVSSNSKAFQRLPDAVLEAQVFPFLSYKELAAGASGVNRGMRPLAQHVMIEKQTQKIISLFPNSHQRIMQQAREWKMDLHELIDRCDKVQDLMEKAPSQRVPKFVSTEQDNPALIGPKKPSLEYAIRATKAMMQRIFYGENEEGGSQEVYREQRLAAEAEQRRRIDKQLQKGLLNPVTYGIDLSDPVRHPVALALILGHLKEEYEAFLEDSNESDHLVLDVEIAAAKASLREDEPLVDLIAVTLFLDAVQTGLQFEQRSPNFQEHLIAAVDQAIAERDLQD